MRSPGTDGVNLLVLLEDLSVPVGRVLPVPVAEVVELDGRLLCPHSNENTSRLMDILTLDELYGLNQIARSVASTWYRCNGVDHTLWPALGVSVGDCLRFHVGIGVARHLRLAAVLERLIETRDPRSIYVWGTGRPVALRHGRVGRVLVSHLAPTRQMRLHQRMAVLAYRRTHATRALRQWFNGNPVHSGVEAMSGRRHLVAPSDATMGGFIGEIAARLDADITSRAEHWAGDSQATRWVHGLVEESWSDRCSELGAVDALSRVPDEMRPDVRLVLDELVRDLHPFTIEMLLAAAGLGQLNARRHVDAVLLPMIWGGELRALGQAAEHLGLPTFVTQDGLLAPYGPSNLPPVRADHALVLGPSGLKWFTEAGMDEERLLVAGRCMWGAAFFTACASPAPSVCGRTPTVLYLAPRPASFGAQHSLKEAETQIEAVCSAVSMIPGCRLVVRLHPRTKEYPGSAWVRRVRRRLRVDLGLEGVHFDSASSLEECAASADVVVCYSSTIPIQMACLGKRIVIVDLSGGDSGSWKGWSLATTPGAIGPAVSDALACRDSSDQEPRVANVTEHVSDGVGLNGVAAYINGIIA